MRRKNEELMPRQETLRKMRPITSEGFDRLLDVEFANIMFHRRHVYEHQGGEADEKYIADSGDNTVKPKQALRETVESAHRIATIVLKLATNLHRGFHEIFPPEQKPVEDYRKRQEFARNRRASGG